MSGWFLFAPRATERGEAKTLSSQSKYERVPGANRSQYDKSSENELAVLELSARAHTGCEAGQQSYIATFDDIKTAATSAAGQDEGFECARMYIISEALCEYGTMTTRAWNNLNVTATEMGSRVSHLKWFGIHGNDEISSALCPSDGIPEDSPFVRKLCEWNEQAELMDSDPPMLMASSPSDDPIEIASLPTHAQLLTVARASSITWESIEAAPPGSPATYGPLYLLSRSTLTAVRRASFPSAAGSILPCTAYETSVEMDVDAWLRSHPRATQSWARALAVSLGRFGIDAMGNSETNAHTGSGDVPSAFSFAWSTSVGTAGAIHPWLAEGACEQLLCTVMSLERLYTSTEPVDSMRPPLVQLVQLMYENVLVHFMRHAIGSDTTVPQDVLGRIESTSVPLFAHLPGRDPPNITRAQTLNPMCAALQLITAWAGILFHASDHMTDNACINAPWADVAMTHPNRNATWIVAPMTAPQHSLHSRAWTLASTADYYATAVDKDLYEDAPRTAILAERVVASAARYTNRCCVCSVIVEQDAMENLHLHLHARKCITAIKRATRAVLNMCTQKADHGQAAEPDARPRADATDDSKSDGSADPSFELVEISNVLDEAVRQVVVLFGCDCLGVQVNGRGQRTIRTNERYAAAVGMLDGWNIHLPMPHFAVRCGSRYQ